MNRLISNPQAVRLTVKDILEAYDHTGIKPVSNVWLRKVEHLDTVEYQGCAITALWLRTTDMDELNRTLSVDEMTTIVGCAVMSANKWLGVDNVVALLLGFSNTPQSNFFNYFEKEYWIIGNEAARQLGLIPFSRTK